MRYEIKGAPLPVVECMLEQGESLKCESGAMSWMSDTMEMETAAGGLGKIFSKALTGEKVFQNTYTAKRGPGYIAFASSFPGDILAIELTPGHDIICQKSAFLASTPGVEISIFFQKKVGAGLFGGEGFVMQRLSGTGLVFLEIDGSVMTRELAAGEKIIVDTGYLAMADASCSIDVVTVKGVKNVLFGGEGLFNTVVTGPGKVSLQTMPASSVANALMPYLPLGNNKD